MGLGRWAAAFGMGAVLVACGGTGTGEVRQETHVNPVVVPGNPSCPAGTTEFKIEGEGVFTDGTFSNNGFSVVLDFTGSTFSFDANQGVDQVIVKGGPNANVYTYSPEEDADTGLSPPINPNNGQPYGFSHISFCFDEEETVPLEVTKTATTRQHRGYVWDIDKDGECPVLGPLQQGASWELAFTVTLTPTLVEGDWTTSGTISIHNPNDVSATITDVVDLLDGNDISDDVDCGVTFPYVLAADATLECDYLTTTAAAPEENTVTVETSGAVEGDSATVDVTVGAATSGDECVTVEDSLAGDLGEVCFDDADKVIEYTFILGPEFTETCGWQELVNIATFTTNDTQTEGSDEFTTNIWVQCEEVCPTTTESCPADVPPASLSAADLAGSCLAPH